MSDKESDKEVSPQAAAPGRGTVWRPLTRSEVRTVLGHRCACIGLQEGDCSQTRVPGSMYCYYHDKMFRGVITTVTGRSATGSRRYDLNPATMYPVWPLPRTGYVLIADEKVAA